MTSDTPESLKQSLEDLKREKAALQKIISHDIRSPFNKVFALIELMKMDEDQLTEEHKGYLENMYQAIMSGTELIRNLHDARQIDEGKFTLNFEETDIANLIQRSIRHFEELARLKGMSLKFANEAEVSMVNTDAHYLQRSLENLISNAIKFSLKGKDSYISLSRSDNEYIISVEDNGPGVKPEEVPDLFSKFKKLSNAPTGSEGATGLGLFLTNYYVEALGGKLSYKKADRELGSIFSLRLPV